MKKRPRFVCRWICLCLLCSVVCGAGAEAGARWVEAKDGWLYLEGTTVTTGWKEIDGSWYWFDDLGYMVTGWKEIDSSWYYFTEKGPVATGSMTIDGMKYDFDDNGVLQDKPEGAALTGWQEKDGAWYYYKEDGTLQTGWLRLDGKWYWFADDGAMATGRQEIDGTAYFFDNNGLWKEEGGELTLFGIPWRSTLAEAGTLMPDGVDLHVYTTTGYWTFWYGADAFLRSKGTKYYDELGVFAGHSFSLNDESSVYYGIPVDSIDLFFLFPSDENEMLTDDIDNSRLVCAEMDFRRPEDPEQAYQSVLTQLTEQYGAPADHTEEKDFIDRVTYVDFWEGKNGSYMALSMRNGYDLTLRYTFDGMDAMVEEAHEAYVRAKSASVATGEPLKVADGTPLKLDGFTVNAKQGMLYEILDIQETNPGARYYAAVCNTEDNGEYNGDRLAVYKFPASADVQEVYAFICSEREAAGAVLQDSESLYSTEASDYYFANASCTVYGDSRCAYTLPDKAETYFYYFRLIVFPEKETCFAICSFDSGSLSALDQMFDGIVVWD